MKKYKNVRFAKSFLGMLLAVLVVLGSLSVLFTILPVSAASGFDADTKVYVNAEKYADFAKTGIKPVAQCLNSSGDVLATVDLTVDSSGMYTFTAKADTATVEILRKDTSMPDVTTPVAAGCERIFFKNTSGFATPYAYAWYMQGASSVKTLGEWPGDAMSRINNTDYYYVDVPTASTNIIFSSGAGGTQTDNLLLDSERNLYTHNTNLWSVYGVLSTISADVTARPNESANTFYVTGETTGKWSKYASPLAADMVTVYVKATSWSSAYVTYDPSDPLSIVEKGTTVNQQGESSSAHTGYYKVQVPADSNFVFKPNSGSDTAGSTSVLTLPAGFSSPCYNVIKKTWQELSQIEDYTDYTVSDTYSDNSNILGVSATYYDYLSNAELKGSWLNPIQAGTGFNGSDDNWYPFFTFNQQISALAQDNSSWKTPLYFGNFCNTDGAYDTSDHHSTSWANVTSDKNAYNFNYLANNSNGLKDMHASYQGLVYDSLINDHLYVTDSLQAPYFNNEWLQENGAAKIIKGTFPFTVQDNGDYKYYEFNSVNAEDNVYFTWDTDGTHTYPTKVNYGAGSSYGISDGIKYFMNGGTSGKGIFSLQ